MANLHFSRLFLFCDVSTYKRFIGLIPFQTHILSYSIQFQPQKTDPKFYPSTLIQTVLWLNLLCKNKNREKRKEKHI